MDEEQYHEELEEIAQSINKINKAESGEYHVWIADSWVFDLVNTYKEYSDQPRLNQTINRVAKGNYTRIKSELQMIKEKAENASIDN